MKKSILLWIIAFVLTILSAYYQRISGPTYPINVSIKIDQKNVSAKLERSHGGTTDHTVKVLAVDTDIKGILYWKRYKTSDDFTPVEMKYENGYLIAQLPNQPPAGKLLYHVELKKGDKLFYLPDDREVIIRFKGDVPTWVLIPHIIFIFMAMFVSVRTGIQVFYDMSKVKKYTLWTLFFMGVGGLIFGPIVQKYAFGEYWTGFPFGYDLTDNKTLIAFIAWLVAYWAVIKFPNPKKWVLAASIITFVVFLIPHSVLGSELDYNKLEQQHKNRNQNSIIFYDYTPKTLA